MATKAGSKINRSTLNAFLRRVRPDLTPSQRREFVDGLDANSAILVEINTHRSAGSAASRVHGFKSSKGAKIAQALAESDNAVLAAAREKLLALLNVELTVGEADINRGPDVPDQAEMDPDQRVHLVNEEPAFDPGRPDQIGPPPPEGEAKEPDFANQVPQDPLAGFQHLQIPEEVIRNERRAALRKKFPDATPDVIDVMAQNMDDGIAAGRRPDTADDILERSEGTSDGGQPSGVGPFLRQLAQARNIGQDPIEVKTNQSPQQHTRDAFAQLNEQIAAQPVSAEHAESVAQAQEELVRLEEQYPSLAGQIGYAGATMIQHLRDAAPGVISAVPWLAYTIISYHATRTANPIPLKGSAAPGNVVTLLATLASAGLNAPQGVRDWIKKQVGGEDAEARTDEDADAGKVKMGDEPDQAVEGAPQMQGDPQPDARDAVRERFNIPQENMPADQRANIFFRIRDALGGGVTGAVVNQIIDYARGRIQLDPSTADAARTLRHIRTLIEKQTKTDTKTDTDDTEKDKKEKDKKEKGKGRTREIEEEPIELKFRDAVDPAVGDLRPSFKQLGTDADTETPEQKVVEQFKFASFKHVAEGHGNGPNNPLYQQMKTWENMVRFVNNFIPAVDRLGAASVLRDTSSEDYARSARPTLRRKIRKEPQGDPDMLFVDQFPQKQPLPRPGALGTSSLEHPTIAMSNVYPPTDDYAEFKKTNARDYPVAGTSDPRQPRTTYSNPASAAGEKFPTRRYDTQSSLEIRMPPRRVIPGPEPIAWTSVSSSYEAKPQEPFTREFGGTINNPYGTIGLR
jgi:hypothetical protein